MVTGGAGGLLGPVGFLRVIIAEGRKRDKSWEARSRHRSQMLSKFFLSKFG